MDAENEKREKLKKKKKNVTLQSHHFLVGAKNTITVPARPRRKHRRALDLSGLKQPSVRDIYVDRFVRTTYVDTADGALTLEAAAAKIAAAVNTIP